MDAWMKVRDRLERVGVEGAGGGEEKTGLRFLGAEGGGG